MSESAIAPYARAFSQSGLAYPTSYAPAPPKPSVWEAYRSVLAPAQPTSALESAVVGVRHSLESAAIGLLLGYIHGKTGTLDIAGRYPVDGIAAVVLLGLSMREAGKPNGYSSDLRAMSQSCTSIAFFRKTSAWAAKSNAELTPSSVMSGHNPDPLMAAAKRHGL